MAQTTSHVLNKQRHLVAGQGTPAGPCQHCNRVIVLLFAGFIKKYIYFVIIVSCLLCSDLKCSSFLHLLITNILDV